MTNIINLNSQRFSINGIEYYKNFLSVVNGDNIRIVNAYDSCVELLRWTKFDKVKVNEHTFSTAKELQSALLPVLYTRNTLGNITGTDMEDRILQIGEIEIEDVGNQKFVRIPNEPEPIWRIGGVEYTKESPTLIPIPPASEGMYRVDRIVGNTSNDFERIAGTERPDVGLPPQLPPNTIDIAQVDVYGDSVDDTPPAPIGFVTKSSKGWVNLPINTSEPVTAVYSPERTSFDVFKGIQGANQTATIRGLQSFSTIESGIDYDGVDIYFRNKDFQSVVLKHNDSVQIPFKFIDQQDLVLETHEIAHLKYYARENRVELVAKGKGSGGSAVFDNDIVVALPPDHTLGKYSNGDTIPAQGKTFEEVMNDIAQAVINPTFVAPTFGLSSSVSGTREIGTTLDVTLTANFNRGRINGAIVGGVWNPTAKQADRAGAATDYEFQGVSNGTNNVKTINDYLVTSGSNSFSSKVTYAEGAQPKNSVGDDYSTPLPAGNMTANTAFTGALYRFFGAGPETVDFRTLSRLFDTTNINNTFDLPTGVTHNNFHLLIPKARELEKVELVEASFADITSEYVYQGIINVPDANGDLHEYKYYLMTTAIPYSSNSTHRIKIKNA